MAYAKGTGAGLASINTIISKHVLHNPNLKVILSAPPQFRGWFPVFLTHSSLAHIELYSLYLLSCFLPKQRRHNVQPNKFLQHWTWRTQTADILHEHSEDSRRQLCSPLLQCNNSDFTLVSYSLTAVSSLRLPMVLPFEADLISHIRTSIFLKRAE